MSKLFQVLTVLPRGVAAIVADLVFYLPGARQRHAVVARDAILAGQMGWLPDTASAEWTLTRQPYPWLVLNAQGQFDYTRSADAQLHTVCFSRLSDMRAFLDGCCR